MSRDKPNLFTPLLYLCIGVAGAALIVGILKESNPPAPQAEIHEQATQQANASLTPSVASHWQWEPAAAPMAESQSALGAAAPTLPHESGRISSKQVYEALKSVRLNESGELILDHEAKLALDAALTKQELDLDPQELAALQRIIEHHLPGTAGEQLAQLVANYYQLLIAENEMLALYDGGEPIVHPSSQDSPAPIHRNDFAQAEARYEELSALRELYLGYDTAEQLYAHEDAHARYMLESFKVSHDPTLNEEQKQAALQQLRQSHAAESLNIDNWQQRLDAYLDQKQRILDAAVNQQQQQQQIAELYRQHFSADERAKVAHLRLDAI